MITVFPSEADEDLRRFWRGKVAGTWSATSEDGDRIICCVSKPEAWEAAVDYFLDRELPINITVITRTKTHEKETA